MRKSLFLILLAVSYALTGCFDTVQETTINEDGTGTYMTSSDLSVVLGLVKNMGGEDVSSGIPEKMDTIINLGDAADAINDLSEDERQLISKGVARIKMDTKNDTLVMGLEIPFDKLADVKKLSAVSGKLIASLLELGMGGSGDDVSETGMDEMGMPKVSSFDEYFVTNFSESNISRKIDQEKYKQATTDEFLKGLLDVAGMGIESKLTCVYNLPRPATTIKGENITLSEDRMKVTSSFTINEFFDEPSKLEFKIEY